MDETLRQIGGLLLGAIPTVIFFLLLFGLYTFLVHKPLARVLAERRARTQGAVEKARTDVAAAEARTAEYEQRLRDARVALFKAQEARRAKASQLRAQGVADARYKAQSQIDAARAAINWLSFPNAAFPCCRIFLTTHFLCRRARTPGSKV